MKNQNAGFRCTTPPGPQAGEEKKAPVGFTLIELLVVMAIMLILAAIILNTAGYIQKKGARARAEAEIAAMSTALERFKVENGDYPSLTNAPGAVNTNFMASLMPASGKVYMEFDKRMTNASGVIDPFGTTYGYEYPGNATRNGSNFFDLYSTAGTTTNSSNEPIWVRNWQLTNG